MNTLKIACLIMVALLGCFGNLAAQQLMAPGEYVVLPGDSAWRVAESVLHDPLLWQQVVKDNPLLQEKGRVRVNPSNGWTYVMMHPGEHLYGLDKVGILPSPTPLPTQVVVPTWVRELIGLLVALLLLALLVYLINRILNKNAATSGPAMVPGGVTETNAQAAMQQVAARASEYGVVPSQNPLVYQQFTILRQTAGRIWGSAECAVRRWS